MSPPLEVSKIFVPFLPPLLHMAAVQVAVTLLEEFGIVALKTAIKEIKRGNWAVPQDGGQEESDVNYAGAKRSLLFIPRHLRGEVMNVVTNMYRAMERWIGEHGYIFGFEAVESNFFWSSDGTINRTKTAKEMVLNENLSITNRFELACLYCLGDSIQPLWAEVVDAGETEKFENADEDLILFWIRWVRDGSQIPWTQVLREFLDHPWIQMPKFGSIFPLLLPEERRNYLCHLGTTYCEDLRLCLHIVTQKEEEEILMDNIQAVIGVYLEIWPMQNMFLEVAEKVWRHIDADSFCELLEEILYKRMIRKDCDFNKIFDEFWNNSSDHFKQYAIEWSRNKSDSLFSELKRKEKKMTNEYSRIQRES